MGSLADHILANILPSVPGSVDDKLLTFFSANFMGSGSPEGVVVAGVGSRYQDMTGGTSYIKTSGTGNTGWATVDTAGAASFPMNGTGAAAGTDMITTKVTADSQARFIVNADGKLEWGPGNAAQDVALERGGSANTLKVTASAGLQVGVIRSDPIASQLDIGGSSGCYIKPTGASGTGLTIRGAATTPGELLQFQLNTSSALWSVDASGNVVIYSASGVKIGTATTQKLGFFNATPVVQPASTDDLRQALINLGLYATGGATPLNLNGGTLTGAAVVASGSTSELVADSTGGGIRWSFRSLTDSTLVLRNGNSGTVYFTFSATSLTLSDAVNIAFNTTTGTKIGTATGQKLSFWNATPIVQPTTAIAAATFVANTSAIANDTATWDGYTIGKVVKALRNIGILA